MEASRSLTLYLLCCRTLSLWPPGEVSYPRLSAKVEHLSAGYRGDRFRYSFKVRRLYVIYTSTQIIELETRARIHIEYLR